jgi:hypothetical protein
VGAADYLKLVVRVGSNRGAMLAWVARWDRQLGWVVCTALAIGFAIGAVITVHEVGIERTYVTAPACNEPNALNSALSGTCTRADRTVETVAEVGSRTAVSKLGTRGDETSTTVTLELTDKTGLLAPGAAGYAVGIFTDQDTPAAGTAAAPQSLVAQVWQGNVEWVQDGVSGPRSYANTNPASANHSTGLGLLGVFSGLCFAFVLLRWRLDVLWRRGAEPTAWRRLAVLGACLAVAVGSMVMLAHWVVFGLIPLGAAVVVTAAQPYLWRRTHPAQGLSAAKSYSTPKRRRR